MLRFLKWTLIVLLVVALLAALRIALYSQTDDQAHLDAKHAYLQSLQEVTGAKAMPNIVLILFDDLGYGDLGSYGNRAVATPNIDSLATGGARFTQYYTASAVCTPSRAALLTGRYPKRAGLTGVMFPSGTLPHRGMQLMGSNTRLPREEILLPEVLKAKGYRTGMVGKWHLGDHGGSEPLDMGFDSWFGTPYSNDMVPFTIVRNGEVVAQDLQDQSNLSADYTREAKAFIEDDDAAPFFLYFAHNFPHIPLFTSKEQSGKSPAGLYGDVLADVDRGVGELVAALRKSGKLDNTLIIVSSDNGPWYQGDAGPSRGRKGKTFDGGHRVPLITHWPGVIPAAQVSDVLLGGVDLMPSIMSLVGVERPTDRVLDGEDRLPQLLGQSTKAAERFVYFYHNDTLQAVRGPRFKYQTGKPYNVGIAENFSVEKGPFLFDLSIDERESYDTSDHNGKDLARMKSVFDAKVRDMAANPRGWR